MGTTVESDGLFGQGSVTVFENVYLYQRPEQYSQPHQQSYLTYDLVLFHRQWRQSPPGDARTLTMGVSVS